MQAIVIQRAQQVTEHSLHAQRRDLQPRLRSKSPDTLESLAQACHECWTKSTNNACTPRTWMCHSGAALPQEERRKAESALDDQPLHVGVVQMVHELGRTVRLHSALPR